MNEWIAIVKEIQPYSIGLTFAAIYGAEHIIPQRQELIDHKHDVKNILVGLINVVIAAAGGYVTQQVLEYTGERSFGLLPLLFDREWVVLVISFVCIDCAMYWWHRLNHTIPFFWQFHRFHHVDEKLNSTSALRFHAAEVSLSYLYRLSLFVVLGVPVTAILVHGLLFLPVVVFHHSNVRISERLDVLLRYLLVTPRMHRIHHSKIRSEANSNYSSLLPYWDALFRTYTHKPDKEVAFGIEHT